MAETNAEFFKMNDRKMDALIKATVSDMEKAETAILRMANDKYRKVIFDAQVYANSGAGTYEKAVDMATRDFLAAGLNCVEYKNGARHTLKDYAEMSLKTATKRAYLTGEGEKRKEWGISTVIMNKRGNPCPQCLPWVGKILIDDVWSGGSSKDGDYPLMSTAIAANLYHPRCRDSHSTYFEGISTPPDDKFTKDEIKEIEEINRVEAKKQNAQRQAEKFGRLATHSLDENNKNTYSSKEKSWRNIEKSYNESIIKSLDLDDFEMAAYGREIEQEVLDVISGTIKDFEREGGMHISEAHFGEFFDKETGKPALFQIIVSPYGLTEININEVILRGKSLEEIDKEIAKADSNLPQTLIEAIIHECGHAKAYYGKSTKEVSEMNLAIKGRGVSGISLIAEADGAECIAEVEVLLHRGVPVPEEAMLLYKEYVKGI